MSSNRPSIQLSVIKQIAITVSDVDLALTFYRDILGLEFLFRAGGNLAFLNANGIRLMLTTPLGAGIVGNNSILYFQVPDIESTHQQLVQLNAVSERLPQLVAKFPDHDLWSSFLKDPDGNLIGLMEEKR
ncbi:MAG: glyoxalase [Gammaproteobacteria bacterium CG22_combo_CG10-13_8_21_14_all_40_8]|nr:MAG: glyoxalase [Gammaproteobacteria bacterium CG22_combo_CG10-13_8_21_14_all_40_8]